MTESPSYTPKKRLNAGEVFKPREIFGGFGLGAFIPERIAAATTLSMTAKICYGHLVRRAGGKARCWPAYDDIAESTGIKDRQARRAVKELIVAQLIRAFPRMDKTGRQTSNEFEFIWGPILHGGDDNSDTLSPVGSDRGRMTRPTSTRVSRKTSLEVKNKNHHQGKRENQNHHQGYVTENDPGKSPDALIKPSEVLSSDDDSNSCEYATSKDQIKAMIAQKGAVVRASDLDWIEACLAGRGFGWDELLEELKRHSWSRVTNPVGFLKSLVKNFRSNTTVAGAPVTAADAAARNYRCPLCSSTTQGEGIREIDGKWVPCSCASPEYITRQRARGIFPEESAQCA